MSIDPYAPSVADGRVVRTSVSALQRADSCERAYYYRYVERIPEGDPGKGAIRGKEGHKRLEIYLRTGIDILDPLERLGIERGVLPAPGPGLLLERPIEGFGFADDLPLLGSIDLVNVRHASEGRVEIVDFKFKKSISDYGTKDHELADPTNPAGIQMLGYAAAVARMYPQARELRLAQYTWQTKGRKDLAVTETTIPLETVSPLWYQTTSRIVPKMKAAAAASSAADVPQNLSKCDAYGGCPYKARCHDKTQQILQAFKKHQLRNEPQSAAFKKVQGTMGSLDRFSKPQPVAAAVSPTPPAAPAAGNVLTARQAEQTKRYTVQGKAATFMVGVSGRGGETRYSFKVDGATAPLLVGPDETITPLPDGAPVLADVLPPDAPKSNPEAFAAPSTSVAQVPVQDLTAALEASIAAVTPPAPAAEPEKKTRKRTAKIEDATQADRQVAAVIASAIADVNPTPVPADTGISLYFGCAPVGVVTQTLVKYVNEIDKTVRETAQLTCADIRATSSQDYGFGKWKAYFAALATQAPPPPGHYVVTPGDERVEVVASALQEIAALVVRS